jgi:hypothetical protein
MENGINTCNIQLSTELQSVQLPPTEGNEARKALCVTCCVLLHSVILSKLRRSS